MIETANVPRSPGFSVIVDGLTPTENPGMLTVAVNVAVLPLTFVAVRVTVCEPGNAPIAIEGTLRSLGSIPIAGQ